MSQALVTIIIPTYKRPWEFVKRAVDSVLSQTYENIEVIVVNDNHETDEIRATVTENINLMMQKDSRLKYILNAKNLGGSLARNEGINKAEGEYISFLDDDDEYLPEKIEHQIAFMSENGCDMSFENMKMYNQSGNVVDVREYNDIKSYDNEYLLHYHLMRHMTGTPTFMIKTDKLREIGGFEDARMGQEFYLMLKCIRSGLKIGYNPVCDVKIYKHSVGGITSGKNKIIGEKALFEFKKTFFPELSNKEKRYIRFRHYAVMVVAYLRNKKYFSAFGAGITAFFSSPGDFFREVFGFVKRIIKQRK